MTNLEYFLADPEYVDKNNRIEIYMKDGYDFEFRKSEETHFVKWLVSEHKEPKTRLTRFEYDLLSSFGKWRECGVANDFYTLKRMEEKGYFRNVDMKKTISEILEKSEVIDDD